MTPPIIKPSEDLLANLVRDPLDMVVSAYLYHKQGKESFWEDEHGKVKLVTINPPFVTGRAVNRRLGMRDVHSWMALHPGVLPRPQYGQGYSKYLVIHNSTAGLLAEMVRSLAWDISSRKPEWMRASMRSKRPA